MFSAKALLEECGSKATSEGSIHEKDSDTIFCLSLVDSFKMLSPRNNKRARIKVMQVLFDLEDDI